MESRATENKKLGKYLKEIFKLNVAYTLFRVKCQHALHALRVLELAEANKKLLKMNKTVIENTA